MNDFSQRKTAPQETGPGKYHSTASDPMVKLEFLPGAAILTDKAGIISCVNNNFLKLTGYSKSEVLGKSLTQFWPAPHDDLETICRQVDKTGMWQALLQQRKKDGTTFQELAAISKIPSEDGSRFQLLKIGYVISPAVLKDAAESSPGLASGANENEKSYLDILNTVPYAITISRISDLKYVFVNEAFCKRTGFSRKEVMERRADDLNLFVDKAERQRLQNEIRTNNRLDGLEMRFRSKDGRIYHTLVSARVIRFKKEPCLLYIVTDIGKLKAVQQALQESEESYRSILKLAPYSITIVRLSDGAYLEVNEVFCEFIGYSKEKIIGHTHQDLNIFSDAEGRRRFFKTLLKTGKVNNMEMSFRSRSGEIAEVFLSSRVIMYKGQKCVISLSSDITELKKTQRALMESEESYRAIMEAAPYSITITRLSDGRYVEVNNAFTQRGGYSRDETVGKTYREVGLFKDQEVMKRFLALYLKHGRVDNMEITYLHKSGEERHNLSSARTIRYKGEDCLLFISTNIDDLKKAQKELVEKEETYRTILDTAPYPISINSAVTGKYLQVNKAHTLRSGYRPEEILGLTPKEISIFQDPADLKRLMTAFKRNGQVSDMDVAFRTKDGKVSDCIMSISPIRYQGEDCIVAITVDINELKATQRALEESEARFRTIFETAADPIFLNDMQTGKFMNVNHAACRYLGYGKSDFLTMSLQDIQVFDPINPMAYFSAKDLEKGLFYESRHILKNGSTAIVEISSQQMIHQGQKVLLSIARDITQRKRTEEELARYRENLEQLVAERTKELKNAQSELVKKEKLAVLGQLTATVSHELRNPLGVLRSSNFYLQRKINPHDQKIVKHFKRIDEQISLCDTIVADLLEYTRGRRANAAQQDLGRWLTEVVDIQQKQESIDIKLIIDPNLPRVLYDQEKFRRVIINLITNSVQAVNTKAEDYGKRRQSFDPQICLEAGVQEDHVRITIRDNGGGMDEKTRTKAFEPLFTTRARGTGLGLAIVKKIVEEHDGRVGLNSTPGQGTEIFLTLPLTGGNLDESETD